MGEANFLELRQRLQDIDDQLLYEFAPPRRNDFAGRRRIAELQSARARLQAQLNAAEAKAAA